MSMEPWKPLSFKEFDALEKEPLDRKVERAVAVIRLTICAAVRSGKRWRSSAANPETNAAANEVPASGTSPS